MSTILKIGGSLFRDSAWPAALNDWIDKQTDDNFLLIVGGGELVEVMRSLDSIYMLDQTALHWRCVRMLRHTSEIAFELLSRTCANKDIEFISEFQRCLTLGSRNLHRDRKAIAVVDPNCFYHANINVLNTVPQPEVGWQTSSDAIAIYLAALIQAEQCVLMKSCPVSETTDLAAAAEKGVVDSQTVLMHRYFPNITLHQLS